MSREGRVALTLGLVGLVGLLGIALLAVLAASGAYCSPPPNLVGDSVHGTASLKVFPPGVACSWSADSVGFAYERDPGWLSASWIVLTVAALIGAPVAAGMARLRSNRGAAAAEPPRSMATTP